MHASDDNTRCKRQKSAWGDEVGPRASANKPLEARVVGLPNGVSSARTHRGCECRKKSGERNVAYRPAAAAARSASGTPTTTAAIGEPSITVTYRYSTLTPPSASRWAILARAPGAFDVTV